MGWCERRNLPRRCSTHPRQLSDQARTPADSVRAASARCAATIEGTAASVSRPYARKKSATRCPWRSIERSSFPTSSHSHAAYPRSSSLEPACALSKSINAVGIPSTKTQLHGLASPWHTISCVFLSGQSPVASCSRRSTHAAATSCESEKSPSSGGTYPGTKDRTSRPAPSTSATRTASRAASSARSPTTWWRSARRSTGSTR